jgi:CHAT domain-containing protein
MKYPIETQQRYAKNVLANRKYLMCLMRYCARVSVAAVILILIIGTQLFGQLPKAKSYQKKGEYELAVQYAREAYSNRSNTASVLKSLMFYNLNDIGLIFYWNGYYSEAVDLFKLATKDAKDRNIDANLIQVYAGNMAAAYVEEGKYSDAESLLDEIVATDNLYDANPFNIGGGMYPTVVNLYSSIGRYDKAEAVLFRALNKFSGISSKQYNPDSFISGMMNMGDALKMLQTSTVLNELIALNINNGYYGKAELYANSIYELFYRKASGENRLTLNFQAYLAHFYAQIGNKGRAVELIDLTEKVISKSKIDLSGKHLSTACYMGLAYFEIGEFELATKYLVNTEKATAEKENDQSSTTLFVLAAQGLSAIYRRNGQFERAEQILDRAVMQYTGKKIYLNKRLTQESLFSELMFNKGLVYVDLKKFAEAETHFKKVIENKVRKSLVIKAQMELAKTYSITNRVNEAYSLYQQSLDALLTSLKTDLYAFSEKERAEMIKYLRDGIDEFNFFASKNLDQIPGISGTMYNYQLQVKSILFTSSRNVAERIINSGDEKLIQDFQKLKQERLYLTKAYSYSESELSRSNVDVKKLEAEANRHEKELAQRSEAFSSLLNQNEVVTWVELQKHLAPDAAAIELVRGHDPSNLKDIMYLAIIVRPGMNEPKVVLFPDGYALENRNVRYYRNAIQSRTRDELSYNAFWAPLTAELKSVERIFIAPDGVFNLVNLAGLYDPVHKNNIMDQQDIYVLTSTRDLVLEREKSFASEIVLVGNPKFNIPNYKGGELSSEIQTSQGDSIRSFFGGEISELPGTSVEVTNISSRLKQAGISVEVFTGLSASERNVKALKQCRVLHLATHGFFYTNTEKDGFAGYQLNTLINNPLLCSGILLSGASNALNGAVIEGEDGILTAQEALNLNLDQTELVVLSACETGQGKIENGEGVYGLQRAFQMAGAKSVIVSLWKVDDKATSQLMSSFYDNWFNKNMTKRNAFAEAQRKLMEQYPDPHYWAAFVIVGQ